MYYSIQSCQPTFKLFVTCIMPGNETNKLCLESLCVVITVPTHSKFAMLLLNRCLFKNSH